MVVTIGLVKRKLFTHEDPINLHKILGILSLLSFFYRYAIVYPLHGTLNFTGSLLDWGTVLVHTLLSCSSLIFGTVPERRVIKHPAMIWEEYRLHSIVFTMRSTCVCVCDMLFKDYLVVRQIVIFCHHIIVDMITSKYGSTENTSIRSQAAYTEKRKGERVEKAHVKAIKRAFSYYQFIAMASILLPSDRTADCGYNIYIAIQSSAFLMTLNRKGIIPEVGWFVVYALALILSTFYVFTVFHWTFFFSIFFVFVIRFMGVSKYVIWICFILFHRFWPLYYPNPSSSVFIRSLPLFVIFLMFFLQYVLEGQRLSKSNEAKPAA